MHFNYTVFYFVWGAHVWANFGRGIPYLHAMREGDHIWPVQSPISSTIPVISFE